VWLAVIWSINLHNFMDGINGILSAQALFVFASLALLASLGGFPLYYVLLPLVFAAAVLGFSLELSASAHLHGGCRQRRPGARHRHRHTLRGRALAVTTGLVLCSAFVADATCTLLSRMLRGRRWYSAHREHLYQWLVRAGLSHAKVVALYMSWNLLIALPAVLWMNRVAQNTMSNEIVPAIGVYGLATGAWWLGKRWCLRRVANGGRHAAA
jgi:hypothetical protein